MWVKSNEVIYYIKAKRVERILIVNLPNSNKDNYSYGFIVKDWEHLPILEGGESYMGPRFPQGVMK